MYKRTLTIPLLLLLIVVSACSNPEDSSGQIRLMSFNIRYDTEEDEENAWIFRKDMVADLIRSHRADLVGTQEALANQIADLESRLPEFGWFGAGRDDGKSEGEYSAIFFRKDRFEVIRNGTFWLSETPDIPGSEGWDAELPRVATWGEFRDKATGETFLFFNTHFDHEGEVARKKSAALLLKRIENFAGAAKVLFTGDLNCRPGSEPYEILTSNHMTDAFMISQQPAKGPDWTYHGFEGQGRAGNKIDYIMVGIGISVLNHYFLTDNNNGFYPSDHLPVLAIIKIDQ